MEPAPSCEFLFGMVTCKTYASRMSFRTNPLSLNLSGGYLGGRPDVEKKNFRSTGAGYLVSGEELTVSGFPIAARDDSSSKQKLFERKKKLL